MPQLDALPPSVCARKKMVTFANQRLRFLLPSRYVRVRGADGLIYLNLSESNMMLQRAARVYEYWTASFMRRYLQAGMTAVDVGANKGDYTLLFARHVGPTGRVIAFEPDDANVTWLQRSLDANHYGWVQLETTALSDEDRTATFYPGLKSGWGSLRSNRRQAEDRPPFTVRTRRLDDVLRDLDLPDVDLLKVDVEGAELGVLRGATSLLTGSDRVTLIMDVDVHSSDERAQLFELLHGECGLRVWSLGRSLRPIDDLSEAATIVASKRTLPNAL